MDETGIVDQQSPARAKNMAGESAAIVAYLANKHRRADGGLVPDCPKLYAKWLEWCFFIVTELDSTSLYVMRRHGTNKGWRISMVNLRRW
jgi:glutathione S-transferase